MDNNLDDSSNTIRTLYKDSELNVSNHNKLEENDYLEKINIILLNTCVPIKDDLQTEIERNIEIVNNLRNINSKMQFFLDSTSTINSLENSASIGNHDLKFSVSVPNYSGPLHRSKSKTKINEFVEPIKKQSYLPYMVTPYF